MSFFEFPHTRTYDRDLGWLIKCCENVNEALEALEAWKNETEPKIEEIYDFFKQLEEGDIPEGFKNAIYQWATANLLPIVGKTLKSVIFGLTDEGYFVATYSDSWRDIIFNTTEYDIFTPLQTEFGHLTLSI